MIERFDLRFHPVFCFTHEIRVQSHLILVPRAYAAGVIDVRRWSPNSGNNDTQEKAGRSKKNRGSTGKFAF